MSVDQGAITAALDIAKQAAKKLDTEITAFKIGEDFRIHAPESKERGIPVRVTPGGILTIGGVAIAAYIIYTRIGGGAFGKTIGQQANDLLKQEADKGNPWAAFSYNWRTVGGLFG